jgi:uroporphyrin-III C-methyltransferase/precorrin-2 dehydrogenase/sirohydrochlorin ferrochelatase
MSFPLVLDLRGRRCLVVGSTDEARARVLRLLSFGARVRWVIRGSAPEPGADTWADAVDVVEREWQPMDLDDVWLVVLADRDAQAAAALGAACEARQRFFCAIDQPGWNSFNHVAIVEQGPVQIAISTGGEVPALSRALRAELEVLLGDGRLGEFATELARLRAATAPGARRDVVEKALEGFALEGRLILPGDRRS